MKRGTKRNEIYQKEMKRNEMYTTTNENMLILDSDGTVSINIFIGYLSITVN